MVEVVVLDLVRQLEALHVELVDCAVFLQEPIGVNGDDKINQRTQSGTW